MKVLISGATGLIATEVAKQLEARGDSVVKLVRRTALGPNEVEWHPERGFIATGALNRVDAVVNLAGASIGRLPWTKQYKHELVESRIASTKTLVDAINASEDRPKVFVSGSASGFYGDTGTALAVESDPKGGGFLADLTGRWEAEAQKTDPSVRLVLARTSIVLSQKQGALGRLIPLVKAGIGGPLGTGKQGWAWISLTDEARAIIHLIDTPDALGAFNLTAPEPATCGDIVHELGRAFRRPTVLPAPAFALRLLLGEGANEMLLASQNLSAQKLLDTGFSFEHPSLHSAITWVAGK